MQAWVQLSSLQHSPCSLNHACQTSWKSPHHIIRSLKMEADFASGSATKTNSRLPIGHLCHTSPGEDLQPLSRHHHANREPCQSKNRIGMWVHHHQHISSHHILQQTIRDATRSHYHQTGAGRNIIRGQEPATPCNELVTSYRLPSKSNWLPYNTPERYLNQRSTSDYKQEVCRLNIYIGSPVKIDEKEQYFDYILYQYMPI